jgi:Cu/Ag efflux pump CusA
MMSRLFSNPGWLAALVLALMVMGYFAYTQIGTGFMPHMDEGGFILDYLAKPGTSLTETDRLLRQVEKIITAIPEVDSYSRRTGLQLGANFLTETNTGDFFIHLKDFPRRSIDSIMTELREKIQLTVPGLRVETVQLMEDMIGDLTAVPQPIEIKIFGDNQVLLQQEAKLVAKMLQPIEGVVEIVNGIVISGDAVNIQVDRVKAAVLGLEPDAITRQIQTQLMGTVVSKIQEGDKMTGIRIWTPDNLRARIQQLQQLSLRTLNGRYISLSQAANISILQGQAEIRQENMKPMIAVTARIENRDLGSTMREVKKVLSRLSLPPGMYLEYGGLYQEQQKSFLGLLVVFFTALLLVALLLLFLYEDIYILAGILITTLLSLPGIFIGLWVTGTELNISAMMGMTMIVGMVTEIAIFYFAELNTYTNPGIHELITSGIMRMRPILMTSVISILALLPLALNIGAGSAMQQPLALAIISGLIFATPLVLCFMPALYFWLRKVFLITS